MTTPELAARVLALGRHLTPELVAQTTALYRPLHPSRPPSDVAIDRHAYGPHERQRLSVFTGPAGEAKPVLVFVAGGGLMAPIMAEPAGPFFDNVGLWAARQGMVGVTVSCRLAPEVKWPAGGEDVALALAWIRANARRYDADPSRIVLMGHSAGAGHIATYVANPRIQGLERAGVGAVILVSGPYDIVTLPGGPNKAYYGDDPRRYPACNTVPGLVGSGLPLLVAIAENDSPEFEAQAIELVAACQEARGRLARLVRMSGHNHVSIAQHIGASDSSLTQEISDLVQAVR